MCVVYTTKLVYLKDVAFKLVKHTTQTYYSSRVKSKTLSHSYNDIVGEGFSTQW